MILSEVKQNMLLVKKQIFYFNRTIQGMKENNMGILEL